MIGVQYFNIRNSLFLVPYFLFPLIVSFIFTAQIGSWCNGSTTDSDSVCLGSKPSDPTGPDVKIIFYARLFFCKILYLSPVYALKYIWHNFLQPLFLHSK